jgi:uncharacterized protein YhdP
MFWYTVATLIIVLAIAISLIRIFLPDVKVYREQIEHVASSFLAQEVRIKSMDARLAGLTPMIIFNGVRMMDDSGKHEIMRFDEADVGLDLWRSLANRKFIPKSLTVYGVKLGITRRKDHTLVLQGLNISKLEQQINVAPETISNESGELARWLFERSTLSLKHCTVVWHDALQGKKTLRFDDVNLDIRNDGDRHQFTGNVQLPKSMGKNLAVAFDFNGNFLDPAQWSGKFYSNGTGLQIGNWGIKPAILHTTLEKGVLDLEMWGQWQEGQITAMTTKFRANDFRLNVGGHKKPLDIQLLSALMDWRMLGEDWQLNVNKLRYVGESGAWPQSRVSVRYDKQDEQSATLSLYSSFLRLDDTSRLIQDLKLLDKPTAKLLSSLSPAGELADTYAQYQFGQQQKHFYTLSTRFHDLSLHAYNRFPGVQGLDGGLWADQQHGTVRFDDDSLQLALPRLFREPFQLTRFSGDVQWWHAYGTWNIHGVNLVAQTKDVQTDANLYMNIPEAPASPYLDLQMRFYNGDASQTSHYLPVGIMDKSLVNWLDRAIVNGRVKDGLALFNGRLHDFPFRQRTGAFAVSFDANDITLDYHKGWPALVAKDLNASFSGQGMLLFAKQGSVFGSQLHDTTVKIDRFRQPVLSVDGKIAGSASDAVHFLVESPIAPAAVAF